MGSLVIPDMVRVPAWVGDLESFRRWATSEQLPRHGWFSYINGEIWVDVSMETSAHNQIKMEIARVVGNLLKEKRLGRYFGDRMLLTNFQAGLSTEPDGMFFFHDTLASGRVVMRQRNQAVEIQGSPDLVMEVVSKTSAKKDTVVLRKRYYQAGIKEYWLVDVRKPAVSFVIFLAGPKKYQAATPQAGWLPSTVLGQSFRLTWQEDPNGIVEYTLEVT